MPSPTARLSLRSEPRRPPPPGRRDACSSRLARGVTALSSATARPASRRASTAGAGPDGLSQGRGGDDNAAFHMRRPPAGHGAAERRVVLDAMRRACARARRAACRRSVRAPGAGARTREAIECKRRDDQARAVWKDALSGPAAPSRHRGAGELHRALHSQPRGRPRSRRSHLLRSCMPPPVRTGRDRGTPLDLLNRAQCSSAHWAVLLRGFLQRWYRRPRSRPDVAQR